MLLVVALFGGAPQRDDPFDGLADERKGAEIVLLAGVCLHELPVDVVAEGLKLHLDHELLEVEVYLRCRLGNNLALLLQAAPELHLRFLLGHDEAQVEVRLVLYCQERHGHKQEAARSDFDEYIPAVVVVLPVSDGVVVLLVGLHH